MLSHVVIYNSPRELQGWKRIAPELPVMPSLPNRYRKPGGIAQFEATLGAEVLDGNLREWTKELVDEAHAAGIKVYVDNLGENDNVAGFTKAVDIGVDGIQTDYPDRLLDFIKEHWQSP